MNTRSAGSKKNDEMLRKGRSKQQRISTKISGGEVDDDAMIMVAVVVWMILTDCVLRYLQETFVTFQKVCTTDASACKPKGEKG